MPELRFDAGSLVWENGELPVCIEEYFTPDMRTGNFRGRACDYGSIVLALRAANVPFEDHAKAFSPLPDLKLVKSIVPRPHQSRALAAWQSNCYRGVAALPTGSGKTILAILAIAKLKRPTLVLVPTIDLLVQWCRELEKFFGIPVGMLGGGSHTVEPLTVSTYDSAVLQMEFIGSRFAFLIADECHHLPGPEIRMAPMMSIAPYRLGLSATPELPPDRAQVLRDLMGETVCTVNIDELTGNVLSPYVVRTIMVKLTDEERAVYQEKRAVYVNFLHQNGITFRQPSDWGRFLGLCARSPYGKEVFRAFLEQRRISRGGENKVAKVAELMQQHAGEQIIIFTADNPTAYLLGRRFRLPVITHQTKSAERKDFLDRFRQGIYHVLVTSKVLNEGVDVPSVGVGIVLSGSASVREHVQRLGRILRAAPGKDQAILYELVSSETAEESVSARRREHRAYQTPGDGKGQ